MGYNKRPTICWDCKNAIGNCSWSDHWEHKPVKGWVAERSDLVNTEGGAVESYIVISCPEFVPDEPRQTQKLCLSCEFARQRFKESCYCIKYGYIIGYPKEECRGWEREQIPQHTDGS